MFPPQDGKGAHGKEQFAEQGVDIEDFLLGHEIDLARAGVPQHCEVKARVMIAGQDNASGFRYVFRTLHCYPAAKKF
jgi:hypothetical protein